MIKIESLSAEWIAEKRKKYGKDPTIMEGMMGLLAACGSSTGFIFPPAYESKLSTQWRK